MDASLQILSFLPDNVVAKEQSCYGFSHTVADLFTSIEYFFHMLSVTNF